MMKFAIRVSLVWCISLTILVAQGSKIEELEKKILEQQKTLQELQGELGQKESADREYTEKMVAQYMEKPAVAESQVSSGYDKGFFLQNADGTWKFKINGTFRSVLYFAEANAVQNNTFTIPEARIDMHVYFQKDWHARVRAAFDSPTGNAPAQLKLKEAFLEYTANPNLIPRIGAYIIPFSLENEMGFDNMTISATPYSGNMPVRDVGMSLYGCVPGLDNEMEYWLGLYNGEGETNLNFNDDFMFCGYVRFYPLGKDKKFNFQVGGFVNERDFVEDGARLRLGALQNHEVFARDLPGTAGNNDIDDTNGKQYGINFRAQYWMDGVRLEYELFWARYERDRDVTSGSILDKTRSDLEVFGTHFAASYFIALGDPKDGQGVEPLFKVSFSKIDDRNGDGSGFNVKPLGTASDVTGQTVWEIAVGGRVHLSKYSHVAFNWVMYDLKESRSLTNQQHSQAQNGTLFYGGGMLHAFLFQAATKF